MVFMMNPFLMDDSALWPGNSAMNFFNPRGFQRPAYSYEPSWFPENFYGQPYCQPASYQMFGSRDMPQYRQEQYDDEAYDSNDDVGSFDDWYNFDNKKQNIRSQRGNSAPRMSSSQGGRQMYVHGPPFQQMCQQRQNPGYLHTQRRGNRSKFPCHNEDPSNAIKPGHEISRPCHTAAINSEKSNRGGGFVGQKNRGRRTQLQNDRDYRCSRNEDPSTTHNQSQQCEQPMSTDVKQMNVMTAEDMDKRPVGVVHPVVTDSNSNNGMGTAMESDIKMDLLQNNEAGGSDLKNNEVGGSDLKNNEVGGSDLKNNEAGGSDLKNNEAGGSDLKNNEADGSDLKESTTDEINKDASKQGTIKKHPSSADRLVAANDELEGLQKRVESFTGGRRDKEYIVIDEMLTRILLSLDAVESNGDDEIRQRRRELVRRAQVLVSLLEDKIQVEER